MEKKTVEENMSLYNRVRQVPDEAKKPFDTGRFKGTDINPMWRIKALTEHFGPCGIGWRIEVVDKRIIDGSDGQKVAIVGPTGAGKTTMVNLLMKFYEINDGDILIDGVSTKELSRENIHELFCMVLPHDLHF